jgi:hypothetical protein
MLMRDPVLWLLGFCTAATLLLLLDRRAKSRLHALDTWAQRHNLRCERDVPVGALTPLEPLAIAPEVVAVERGIQGQLQMFGQQVSTWLLAVLVGNRHRPRTYLIGIFPAPAETPPLRVLPESDTDAPQNLGYVPMPASALPPGYRAEAFQPLLRSITDAIGGALENAGPDWRIELRAGRILVATPAWSPDKPEQLISLGAQLTAVLHQILAVPPGAEPEPAPESLAPN